ncbi:uncharacterized protein KY384_006710 [Bacidia gigantensis]|uniref:uncharacterized protein n=1 Tax=Bacidia gigantensis TaxID=2732470 RepID=UPI001D056881|nr:uncharacterized protein KY384_006710 [Bacidia gigantensis]KAG8529020.1 hypothetical protein KY384_006710 [Bacidia gigantensis]
MDSTDSDGSFSPEYSSGARKDLQAKLRLARELRLEVVLSDAPQQIPTGPVQRFLGQFALDLAFDGDADLNTIQPFSTAGLAGAFIIPVENAQSFISGRTASTVILTLAKWMREDNQRSKVLSFNVLEAGGAKLVSGGLYTELITVQRQEDLILTIDLAEQPIEGRVQTLIGTFAKCLVRLGDLRESEFVTLPEVARIEIGPPEGAIHYLSGPAAADIVLTVGDWIEAGVARSKELKFNVLHKQTGWIVAGELSKPDGSVSTSSSNSTNTDIIATRSVKTVNSSSLDQEYPEIIPVDRQPDLTMTVETSGRATLDRKVQQLLGRFALALQRHGGELTDWEPDTLPGIATVFVSPNDRPKHWISEWAAADAMLTLSNWIDLDADERYKRLVFNIFHNQFGWIAKGGLYPDNNGNNGTNTTLSTSILVSRQPIQDRDTNDITTISTNKTNNSDMFSPDNHFVIPIQHRPELHMVIDLGNDTIDCIELQPLFPAFAHDLEDEGGPLRERESRTQPGISTISLLPEGEVKDIISKSTAANAIRSLGDWIHEDDARCKDLVFKIKLGWKRLVTGALKRFPPDGNTANTSVSVLVSRQQDTIDTTTTKTTTSIVGTNDTTPIVASMTGIPVQRQDSLSLTVGFKVPARQFPPYTIQRALGSLALRMQRKGGDLDTLVSVNSPSIAIKIGPPTPPDGYISMEAAADVLLTLGDWIDVKEARERSMLFDVHQEGIGWVCTGSLRSRRSNTVTNDTGIVAQDVVPISRDVHVTPMSDRIDGASPDTQPTELS